MTVLHDDLKELFERVRTLETTRRLASVDDAGLAFSTALVLDTIDQLETNSNITVGINNLVDPPESFLTVGFVGVDTSSIAHTITVPEIALLTRATRLTIKDIIGNASAFNITVTPSAGDTIDGGASRVISTNRGYVTVVPRLGHTDWAVIS
jgi:hypothetical protein